MQENSRQSWNSAPGDGLATMVLDDGINATVYVQPTAHRICIGPELSEPAESNLGQCGQHRCVQPASYAPRMAATLPRKHGARRHWVDERRLALRYGQAAVIGEMA